MFDGVHYGEPFTSPAIASQPHAPLVSDDIVAALVSGYFSARRNALRVVEQPFERLQRDGSDGAAGRWIISLTHVGIASGYAWVDDTFTHAAALVLAECIVGVDMVLNTRLVATDSAATTVNGPNFEIEVADNATTQGDLLTGSLWPDHGVVDQLGGGLFFQAAELELDGAGLQLSDRLLLEVQSYAGTALVPGYYRPRYAVIYLECRG